jgi:hypothetical protein
MCPGLEPCDAGAAGEPIHDFETWDRICKLYGWPQTFVEVAAVEGRQ